MTVSDPDHGWWLISQTPVHPTCPNCHRARGGPNWQPPAQVIPIDRPRRRTA